MFGFGIVLMHIADYLTRRKYDKEKKRRRSEKEELVDKKIMITTHLDPIMKQNISHENLVISDV